MLRIAAKVLWIADILHIEGEGSSPTPGIDDLGNHLAESATSWAATATECGSGQCMCKSATDSP